MTQAILREFFRVSFKKVLFGFGTCLNYLKRVIFKFLSDKNIRGGFKINGHKSWD